MPQFAMQGTPPAPVFHLSEFMTTAGSVQGLCTITTQLHVPQSVIQSIESQLRQKGVSHPTYQPMPFISVDEPGTRTNQAFLTYASADGMASRSIHTEPEASGDQTAIFDIPNMDVWEVDFFKRYFGGDPQAGTVRVAYQLTVWARLGEVTAKVHFDAKAAYEYQRTYQWVKKN